MPAVIRRRSIDAEANPHPRIKHLADRRDPRRKPHIRGGAVRDSGACSREQADPLLAEADAVRVPHILTDPSCIFGIIGGFQAKTRLAEFHIPWGFREMRMQPNAITSRQYC